MADTPKTSFIPKQSMGAAPGGAPRKRHFNILNFAGMVVFLCGMILTVGVFFYKDLSEKDLASEKQALASVKGSFSTGDIESLRRLDGRLAASQTLLDGHLSPSAVFDLLEERTQGDVRFTQFVYRRRESGSAEVALNGTTFRFNTVALQSRQFADAPAFATTVFTDVSIGEDGLVNFTVTSEANTGALRYVAPASAQPLEAETATSTATTTTETLDETLSDLDDLDALLSDTEDLNEGL